MGIPQMRRDRSRRLVAHVAHGRAEGHGDRVRLRRVRQVRHRVGQVQLRLRHPHELDGPSGGVGDDEAVGVGHPDVFGGQDHQPSGDEPRVLARRDHPGQPVQAGVDVGTADALDERRQDVVVLVVAVAECSQRERRFRVREGDRRPTRLRRQRRRDLERRERMAGVALGAIGQVHERVVVDPEVLIAETARLVGERALQERAQVVDAEGFESEQRRAREERAGQREERVLGGGTDEDEQSFLDVGKQRVLLRAIEAVHLVEEEDGAPTLLTDAGPGTLRDLADILHPGGDRGERLERLGRRPRDQSGDGGLAGTRRPPEDHRRQAVGLDQDPQWTTRTEELLLAEHLVERPGPQPGGQRRPPFEALRHGCAEQVFGHLAMLRGWSA